MKSKHYVVNVDEKTLKRLSKFAEKNALRIGAFATILINEGIDKREETNGKGKTETAG